MTLSLFDLHCDTPHEMLCQNQPLGENQLAVSLQKARCFEQYVQVMAFWCDKKLGDEDGWKQFEKTYQNFAGDPALKHHKAQIISCYPPKNGSIRSFPLAVEDLRILANDITRVDRLARMGIRIVTPLWANNSCIGGAHNTENGLTDFGKRALTRALEHGMLLDISHASVHSADEIFELSADLGRPVLATHSNAYAICPVSRNLNDRQTEQVIRSGGLIGINLYRYFIKEDGNATLDDLCLHIEHFLSLGAHNALCMGTDFDGCETLAEIPDVSELPRLAERMLRLNYSEHLIHNIFFANADAFARKNFTM